MRNLAIALCLLSVTACDLLSSTTPTSPLDQQFTLAPGQTQSVPDASLSVKFTNVTGDSRCPADAMCVTGGDATVNVEVLRAGRSTKHELHTGSMQPVKDGDFTIQLVEVAPYPFSSRTIAPQDYRVTLRVTR